MVLLWPDAGTGSLCSHLINNLIGCSEDLEAFKFLFKAVLYAIVPRFPFFVFAFQKIAGHKNDIKCGWMSASMKWRHLGHLQLLSRAVAVMTQTTEVSPQA